MNGPRRVVVRAVLALLVLVAAAWAVRGSGDLDAEVALAEQEALRRLGNRDGCLMRLEEFSLGRAELHLGSPYGGTVRFFRFGIRVASSDWIANEDSSRAKEVLYWFHGGGRNPKATRDLCAEARARLTPVAVHLRWKASSAPRPPALLDGVPLEQVKVVNPGPHVMTWRPRPSSPPIECAFTLVPGDSAEVAWVDSTDMCLKDFMVAPVYEVR